LVTSKVRSLSSRSLLHGCVACAIPVHVWSIVNWLQNAEAWLLRFDAWDFATIVAYIQAFALLETVAVVLSLLLLGLILPRSLFLDHFVAQSAVTVLVAAGWIIYLHHNFDMVTTLRWPSLMLWLLTLGITMLASNFAVIYFERFRTSIEGIVDRFAVLAIVYVAFDLIGAIIVLARNI